MHKTPRLSITVASIYVAIVGALIVGALAYRAGHAAGVADVKTEITKLTSGKIFYSDAWKTVSLRVAQDDCHAAVDVPNGWQIKAKPGCEPKEAVITLSRN